MDSSTVAIGPSRHPQAVYRAGVSPYSFGFFSPFLCLWRDRSLIWQMTKREVSARYRGSFGGLLWSFLNPLLLLAVYTFVFGYVMANHKNPVSATSLTKFTFELFAGLIVFNLFSECLNRAPSLILSNVNYVKKVVFPLENLCWIAVGAALFNALTSLLILLVAFGAVSRGIPWTVLFVPLILLPLVLLTAGFTWFLSALGVYVRDVGQIIGIITMILMFLSPIFYPDSSLPAWVKHLFLFNPLTFPVHEIRDAALRGNLPNWSGLALYWALSALTAWLGFFWFQKTRKGFADVI
jgi:lipopolysaccharide transport system permease protein